MTNENAAEENQVTIGRVELFGICAAESMVQSLVNADASNERIKEAIEAMKERATKRASVLLGQRDGKVMKLLLKAKQSEQAR